MDVLFLIKSIDQIHNGLCNGLSRFSGPSRAALVYAKHRNSPLRVYDPCDLLRGHEPRLREHYLKHKRGKQLLPAEKKHGHSEYMTPDLAGIIACGGNFPNMFHQTWFSEHHVDTSSPGPTTRWLEYACRLLSQDLGTKSAIDLETSGYVLQNFATHAVRDHIVDMRNLSLGPDTRLRIYPLLDAVLNISKTREEGKWPMGDLIFVEPSQTHRIHYLATFGDFERPSMKDFKHIRKLLQAVEGNRHKLVSNGQKIIGIGTGRMPDFSVIAEFRGNHGFIRVQDETVCSFADGGFHSSTRQANLVQLEEVLLELNLEPNRIYTIMKVVSTLVRSAQERKHGCALVLDYGSPLANISGQHLETPLDLKRHTDLDLATSLAKVDGALHIDLMYLKLHAFAALLDGRAVAGENRARGARYNSALRFTAENNQVVLVVVSSDRPISIIQHGAEIKAKCDWVPRYQCLCEPMTLEEWIKESAGQE
ncbi:MAG: DNA integrity scanning protein DisA nucleotide-binding domain protein [Desulfomicrobium sp.]|nr:DNA integrity scanning protein DisA nucleotide-binding domain protein [Pseudomonadota bacterium]MBV1712779.1 DNA integrity scanning protein DisA nucleotide-binding domain protein [Desulfomicrobium sp.]MBU4571749.1 DNA integrity scanning protein DisA nucleotide-binding domain protein [Pseudomonadota bacterium]MBU4595898.1 DNA integrity scanning protein DisA nucleotide-binding domain protein [Pseudomonadota bacterium]MBV1721202.1 DNA integrity scanning protein DisA nucleotide-binding domain pr